MCWSQLSATQKWPTQSRCRLKSRLAWAKEPCNLIKLRPGCPNRKKHFRGGGHVPNTPWMMDTVSATAGHQSINQSCIFRVVQIIKSLQDPLEVGNNLPGISDNFINVFKRWWKVWQKRGRYHVVQQGVPDVPVKVVCNTYVPLSSFAIKMPQKEKKCQNAKISDQKLSQSQTKSQRWILPLFGERSSRQRSSTLLVLWSWFSCCCSCYISVCSLFAVTCTVQQLVLTFAAWHPSITIILLAA